MFQFMGKTAVIIGAGNAIGREIAKTCATRGMRLVLADDVDLSTVREEMEAFRAPVVTVHTNPAKYEDIVHLAEVAQQTFGTVDILFNNADAPACPQIDAITVAQFDEAVRRKVYGLYYAYKTFLPVLRAQKTRCHIVNTTSTLGFYGAPGDPAFAATAQGIFGLSEAVDFDNFAGKHDIGMTFICRCREIDGREDAPEEIVRIAFECIEQNKIYAVTARGQELLKQGLIDTELMSGQRTEIDVQAWFGLTPPPSPWTGEKQYAGQTAVVTGAARGIGFAICKQCAQRGMNVVMADIDMEQLKKSELEIQKMGVQTLAQCCDVTQYDNIQALADAAVQKFGTVEMLFNNAGVTVLGELVSLPLRDFEFGIQTNLYSVFYGLKVFLPIMRKQKNACHIGVTASLASIGSEPGMPTYQCGKHAVLGLCQAVYYDMLLKGDNIGMSLLCPGMVQTSIDTCDSRRPPQFQDKDDPYYQTETYKSGRRLSTQNISRGDTPDYIAGLLWEKVEDRIFFACPSHRDGSTKRQIQRVRAARGEVESSVDWDWVKNIVASWS